MGLNRIESLEKVSVFCSRDSSDSRVKWRWMLSRLAEAAEERPRTGVAKHHCHEHAKADSPPGCPKNLLDFG